MILQEEFRKNGYTDILKGDVDSEYGINLEDIFDLDEKPEELLGIFISEDEYKRVGPALGKFYNKLVRFNSNEGINIIPEKEGISLD